MEKTIGGGTCYSCGQGFVFYFVWGEPIMTRTPETAGRSASQLSQISIVVQLFWFYLTSYADKTGDTIHGRLPIKSIAICTA